MQRAMRRHILPLLVGDVASFVVALFIALILRHGAWPTQAVFIEHLVPFAGLMVLWCGVFFIAGLYDAQVTLVRTGIPDIILKAQVINMFLAVFFFFVIPVGITPKTILALYLIASTTLIVLWRLFVFPRITLDSAARVLIVGSGEEAKELCRALHNNPQFGCTYSEVVDIHIYNSTAALGEKLTKLVATERIDTIIADMSDEYTKRLTPLYYNLAFLDAPVRFVRLHELYEQLFCRVPVSLVGKTWFLENVRAGAPRSGYVFLKRAFDIVGSAILLIPCGVIFPFVMAAIKLSDGGKIFYKSERIGQYNKLIHIYKFRSMTGMDNGDTLNTAHVVTPLGRFLRKSYVDEFPQFWNILRGDLSFIGPRPEIPARARVYAETIPYYNMRHLIKPGLSGWAQINNFEVPRGEVDVPRTIDKLSFDLFYLKRHSFFLDVEIFLKTITRILSRTGT